MKNKFLKGVFWKIPIVSIAIFILHYEIDAYTNTKGSIGELLLYPNQENAFLISSTLTSILGFILCFTKSKVVILIIICLICFILLLFYPSFEMEEIDHSF